jgi:hypothetical protein
VLDEPKYADAVSYVRDDFRRLPMLPAVIDRLEQHADR